eukprot:5246747-Alexandrium_andersonii.AAC.1
MICRPRVATYPSGRCARKRRRRASWAGIAARRRRLRSRRPSLESAASLAEDAQLLVDGGVE